MCCEDLTILLAVENADKGLASAGKNDPSDGLFYNVKTVRAGYHNWSSLKHGVVKRIEEIFNALWKNRINT